VKWQLTTLDEAGSTNDDVAGAARAGAPEGLAIFARQQSAGRGRQGRVWQSPPGNVSLSLLLRPPPEKTPAYGQLAFVAALAVGEAVGKAGADWRLKWPNDVFIHGRKVSGILLESEPGWVVAGMGVNVQHCPPVADKPVTSLALEGLETTPEQVVADILEAFGNWYTLWQHEGFMPLQRAWLERAHNLGANIKVALATGQEAIGRLDGLDSDGALLLEKADGTQERILAGDVFFA